MEGSGDILKVTNNLTRDTNISVLKLQATENFIILLNYRNLILFYNESHIFV